MVQQVGMVTGQKYHETAIVHKKQKQKNKNETKENSISARSR